MVSGAALKQGDLVSGLPFDPAGELQFEQNGGHEGGRQLALPDQFVNRSGDGRQKFQHPGARARSRSLGRAAERCRQQVASALGQRRGKMRARARAMMSSALSTSVAPLRMRSLVPRQRGSSGEPGTANTSRPCSSAKRAVMSEPEPSAASTTSTPSAMPEMMRLRRGKWRACGSVPTGSSAISTPRSAIASCSARFSSG